MRISEVFHSIQGEGLHAGTPSVFLRTTGCNLRCWFCDTPETSWQPQGSTRDWEALVEQVGSFECRHVVLTGGEPLLQPDVVPLTRALHQRGHIVTIETAGTVFRPVQADLVSLSPKLANSTPWTLPAAYPRSERWAVRHERDRDNPAVIEQFVDSYEYQLKFVVDRLEDVDEVDEYLSRFSTVPPERVWLMPQAITAAGIAAKNAWIIPAAEQRGYHVSPRLHIELFGNKPGT